jgi:alkaline phosphatase
MKRTTGISATLTAALLWLAASAWAAPAKNIILFIGDGMHLQHEVAASNYLYGEDFALVWHGFPYKNYVTTWDTSTYNLYSIMQGKPTFDPDNFNPIYGYNPEKAGTEPSPLSEDTEARLKYLFPDYSKKTPPMLRRGPATDSASAGTAISTGAKTEHTRIAWDFEGTEDGKLKSISEIMRETNGASIGVVSTVPFSHATPATFSSHNKGRNNFYTGFKNYTELGIADEILTVTRPDVVIGGGHPALNNPKWETTKGYISKALYEGASSTGEYAFAERRAGEDGAELLSAAAAKAATERKKLFGLFGGPAGNFEPPVPADAPGAPAVDRATTENPLLRDVVISALEVLALNENGFFLLAEQGDIDWANHANNFSWMIGTMWDLNEAVSAAVDFIDRPDNALDWENTLLIVTADHANSLMRLNPEKKLVAGDLPEQKCATALCEYPGGEVSYATGGHTNELVSLYAKGAGIESFSKYEGSWYPGTRLIDNTQVFRVMKEVAVGIE